MTINLFAHAGHGTGSGLIHYLSDPMHLISLLVGVAAMLSIAWVARRFSELRPAPVTQRHR